MDILLALLSVIAAVASANVRIEDKDFVYASTEDQIRQGWNSEDKSSRISIEEDGLIFVRNFNLFTRDNACIRGKVGFTEGQHAWDIYFSTLQTPDDSWAVGVATLQAPLDGESNTDMFGIDNQSWGWNVKSGLIFPHPENASKLTYPSFKIREQKTITVLLDMDEGTLSYVADGVYLGVAFTGLRGKRVFPMACTGYYLNVKIEFMDIRSPEIRIGGKHFVYASLEDQVRQGWNPVDKSQSINVKNDELTFYRNNVDTNDCIRGKVGFSEGVHAWEIIWPWRLTADYNVFGVGTAQAELRGVKRMSMFGLNHESWGWNVQTLMLDPKPEHTSERRYPDGSFTKPQTFIVLLDMDEGTLSYVADGRNLGVAFTGLKGKKLYPMACTNVYSYPSRMKFMKIDN